MVQALGDAEIARGARRVALSGNVPVLEHIRAAD